MVEGGAVGYGGYANLQLAKHWKSLLKKEQKEQKVGRGGKAGE